MTKINSALSKRFKGSTSNKMEQLAKRSSTGGLSTFSGIFKTAPLSEGEKQEIEEIITSYQLEGLETDKDLQSLLSITSEVKAINHQAIILHGERIKKAQAILKQYRDGAFTTWLIVTYGNRQTPYNFLQYYDFYQSLNETLREKISEMPKQAIYTLASREGEQEKKEAIVKSYMGEPKRTLLEKIRDTFPLSFGDKRGKKMTDTLIRHLEQLQKTISSPRFSPSKVEKKELLQKLSQLRDEIQKKR